MRTLRSTWSALWWTALLESQVKEKQCECAEEQTAKQSLRIRKKKVYFQFIISQLLLSHWESLYPVCLYQLWQDHNIIFFCHINVKIIILRKSGPLKSKITTVWPMRQQGRRNFRNNHKSNVLQKCPKQYFKPLLRNQICIVVWVAADRNSWFLLTSPRQNSLEATLSFAHDKCCVKYMRDWCSESLLLLWVSPCQEYRTHPPPHHSLSTPEAPKGLIFAPLSLSSWHFCPEPCQNLQERQMGRAFYVLIKEEFAPSQTRHLWPMCLVAFIIHPEWGEPL